MTRRYSLRAPRSARRIDHVKAGRFIRNAIRRLGSKSLLPGQEPIKSATEIENVGHPGDQHGAIANEGGCCRDIGVGYEQPCLAVVRDIGGFLGGQLARYRADIEARPLGCPVDLEIFETIFQPDSDRVARGNTA